MAMRLQCSVFVADLPIGAQTTYLIMLPLMGSMSSWNFKGCSYLRMRAVSSRKC